nr:hypothetical protein [Quadrisphaera sp. INWT6]
MEQVDQGAVLDDPTGLETGHGVGHRDHGVHLVGDEQDGELEVVAELLEQPDDARGGLRVEARGRLVGQQHARAQREGAGDADALALAAGQLVRVAVGLVGQADPLEQLDHARPALSGHHAEVPERQLDVLRGGPAGQQAVGLEDGADAAARLAQLPLAQGGEVAAADEHRARRRALQQRGAGGERRLAGAGRADDGGDLPGGDGQVEGVQHGGGVLALPVGFGELAELDHGWVTAGSPGLSGSGGQGASPLGSHAR